MIAALSLLALVLAVALVSVVKLQRRTSYRLSMARAVAAQARRGRDAAQQRAAEAIERASAAEARVEAVRKQMLTIAEATAADLAARPGPVRCGARPAAVESVVEGLTQPAPESSDAFAAAFYEPLLTAQRVPVFAASKAREPGDAPHAFILRWGDA